MSKLFRRRVALAVLCLPICLGNAEARPRWARRGVLRSVDWKYTGAVLAQFAMANLEAHSTVRCLDSFTACHEGSHWLGERPSATHVYAQLNIFTGAVAVMELYLKDPGPGRKGSDTAWLLGPALTLPLSVYGTVHNFHLYDKFAAQCRASGKLTC